MNKIHILDENLINKIAAGEVVERPASVIKELVDNSIDANAKNIIVEIKASGKELIKVTDDGDGMNKEDLRSSVIRHATSKISTEEDLYLVNTMGFRGEALASISAVADLTIISKEKGAEKGYKLSLNNKQVELVETPSKQGTSVVIENIFANIPARLKFLKTDSTEQRYCIDTFTSIVLANPQIAFTLTINGIKKIILPKDQQIADRIKILFGDNISSNLINIFCDHPHIKIKGFIGKPQLSEKNTEQFISVKQRPITDRIISAAIKESYSNLIMPSLKPTYFIYIQTPPDFIDVNTHPQKKEVKFLNSNLVYNLTKESVSKALNKSDLTYGGIGQSYKIELEKNSEKINEKFTENKTNYTQLNSNSFDNFNLADKPKFKNSSLDQTEFYKNLLNNNDTQFFVLNNLYIIVKTDNGVEILDQHATHEKILYNQIKQALNNTKKTQQKLLIPEKLELQKSLVGIFNENKKTLEDIGFEFEQINQQTKIIAKPTFIKNDSNTYIKEVLVSLDDTSDFNLIDDKTDRNIATMACKGAVKAGDKLSQYEIVNLIKTLDTFDDKYTCPHGRPVKVNLKINDMDRMFKRTV